MARLEWEADDIMRGLYGDGIIALPRAFPTAFADRMHDEITALFEEARGILGGTLPRGPERWYVEVQPERKRRWRNLPFHAREQTAGRQRITDEFDLFGNG